MLEGQKAMYSPYSIFQPHFQVTGNSSIKIHRHIKQELVTTVTSTMRF